MQTSPNGYRFIEAWEGLYLHAYDDGTGTLTIGYGHTNAAGPPRVYRGMLITKDQADAILKADLASVEANINQHVGSVPITQNQYDAFSAFDFNTGSLARSSLLRDFEANHMDRIKTDFEMWSHAHIRGRFVVVPGLLKRRNAEYTLFATGDLVGPDGPITT